MIGKEYRAIISAIVVNAMRQKTKPQEIADLVAKNVHARLYGANIDGVDSPLWKSGNEPNKDATQILQDSSQ